MSKVTLVIKYENKTFSHYCTNSECNGKCLSQIETVGTPLAIYECKAWAEAWIIKQPKEKNVFYETIGVEHYPKIEE